MVIVGVFQCNSLTLLKKQKQRMLEKKCLSMPEFRDFLKKNGLKATPQRIAVHSAMLELGHASADMVAKKIEEKGEAEVTIASLYNTLSSLADLGAYSRRTSSNNKMYFDVNTGDHIHFYDSVNNSYRDVNDHDLLETVKNQLKGRRFKGYSVDSIDIQIIGHPTKKKFGADS